MKRYNLFALLLIAVSTFYFSACGDDDNDQKIFDLNEMCMFVNVVDDNGQNLLEQGTHGNILSEDIYVVHNSDTIFFKYPTEEDVVIGSRYNKPTLSRIYYYTTSNYLGNDIPNPSLCIEGFEGFINYGDSLTLHIGEQSYELSFSCTDLSNRDKYKFDCEFTYYLNDKKIDTTNSLALIYKIML